MTEEDPHKQPTQPEYAPSEACPIKQPEIPAYIGPYKIESLLDRGGMSILYLGTHPDTKEPTAVKVLSPRYLSHPFAVQRFLDEATIISMADHPNIVKLYGHGEWEGGLYIAMEFIEGISLRQYLLRTPISLKRALEMIIDIAYALCHLHTHGVIHRDLKPENIIVTEDGVIKVIDFGIAQLLTEEAAPPDASKPRLTGTPIYISPEQQRNAESVSFPSDIYSLGIVSYELILGKLCLGHIHLSLMPQGIQPILKKALQPRPEDRYQDVVDLISDISDYLHSSKIHKERRLNDKLSELSESLQDAEQQLLFSPSPSWHHANVAINSYKGTEFFGLFYDFISLKDGTFGVIVGESPKHGVDGLLHISSLRGMVRALNDSLIHPDSFLKQLNTMILNDTGSQLFKFTLVILDPARNTMKFFTAGSTGCWLHPLAGPELIPLQSACAELGSSKQETFTVTTYPWNIGDTFIFSGFSPRTLDSGQDVIFVRDYLEQAINEFIDEPPDTIVNQVIRKLKIDEQQPLQGRTYTVLAIQRRN